LGSDILTGGAGMDIFIWNEIDNGATDTITDFSISEGDKIDLRDILPELKQPTLDMDALLENIDAKVDGDNIELTIYANGAGSDEQTILIESLVPQLTIVGNGAADIVTALLDQHVLVHDS
jgi:Ca2+-binding RTX toxin-like protein